MFYYCFTRIMPSNLQQNTPQNQHLVDLGSLRVPRSAAQHWPVAVATATASPVPRLSGISGRRYARHKEWD